MLDEEVVAGNTFDVVEKLRVWMGEVGALLKKSMALHGVREVSERKCDELLMASA